LRSLWLERGEREKYESWFNDLWSKLQYKREEAHKRYEDWHARQEQGLEKLRDVRDRMVSALGRVRDNNSVNRDRLSESRSSEHSDRVSEWIREGEEKERDIERSIDEIESRIREAEDRLRR
jgi:gas vesicle protein